MWSGSFPPYQSTARVNYQVVPQFSTNTDPSRIQVTVGTSGINSYKGSEFGNSAAINLNVNMMTTNTPAHEFGHALGLNHPWGQTNSAPRNWVPTRNIMDYVGLGSDQRRVEARNFDQLIRNADAGVPITTLQRDGASFSDTSAAGGYLLYPNKSNLNNVRNVYAK
jgi:hypothetical protein